MLTNELELIVLVGLPASGKSTFRDNSAFDDYYHFSSDDLIEAYAKSIDSTYNEVFTDYVKEATRLANEGLQAAIAEKRSVIWDQTNMSRKKRAAILSKFPKEYVRRCICVEPPETAEDEYTLSQRLKSRPGKDIPAFVMANMRKSYQKPNLEEGFLTVAFSDINGDVVKITS